MFRAKRAHERTHCAHTQAAQKRNFITACGAFVPAAPHSRRVYAARAAFEPNNMRTGITGNAAVAINVWPCVVSPAQASAAWRCVPPYFSPLFNCNLHTRAACGLWCALCGTVAPCNARRCATPARQMYI